MNKEDRITLAIVLSAILVFMFIMALGTTVQKKSYNQCVLLSKTVEFAEKCK